MRRMMIIGLFVLASCTQQTASPTTVAIAPTVAPSPIIAPTQPALITATPNPTTTPNLSAEQRQKLFDNVWLNLKVHFLADNEPDWAQLKAEFAPQIQAATNDDEVYRVLQTMTQKLGDANTVFLSPTQAQEQDGLNTPETYVGIGVLIPNEKSGIIAQVFPDSPAAEAGLKRGMQIVSVDGQPFKNFDQIRGVETTQVTLTIRPPQSEPRDFTITRRKVMGNVVPISQRLAQNPAIGYIFIPTIIPNMDELVKSDLEKLQATGDLKGLIIDLRSSSGDWLDPWKKIMGNFAQGNIGTFTAKEHSTPRFITASKLYDTYHALPLIVLIDNSTEWYPEIVAGVLQQQGATVIGMPSKGNSDFMYKYDFNDGSRLWITQERFTLLDGTTLQGKGVQPNMRVEGNWTDYELENDPAILKAIEVIQQK